MAEIRPKMYDIMHPVPISLQELSAIAVSLEIWRCEINKYRQNGTLQEFRPKEGDLSSKNILPDLPSVICDLIDEYIEKCCSSLHRWLNCHHNKVFYFQYSHVNDVLEDFDNFVCDFDGNIHFARTAERIIQCDRFDLVVKFATACNYFFEDDIKRIWPFVSEQLNPKKRNFSRGMILSYWIRILTKQFDKLPVSKNGSVDELMLEACAFQKPAVEYFWNRLPIESRLRSARRHSRQDEQCFVRFILPKMDDELLDKFVNWEGRPLMRRLVNSSRSDERLILSTWMYIRNVMNESTFTALVVDFLQIETEYLYGSLWPSMYCEIWNSAPDKLKRSTTAYLSSDRKLTLCDLHDDFDAFDCTSPNFLLVVLSYATLEERSSFWSNFWRHLTLAYNLENMLKIMEVCLKNEDEIILFRKKIVAKCASVRRLYEVGIE